MRKALVEVRFTQALLSNDTLHQQGMVMRDGLDDAGRRAAFVVGGEYNPAPIFLDGLPLDDLSHRAISPLNVYVGFQDLEPADRGRIVEDKNCVYRTKMREDLCPIVLSADRSPDAFEFANGVIGIHPDDQEIAAFSSKREIAHVANVQNVEATVCGYDLLSPLLRTMHELDDLLEWKNTRFARSGFCGTLRSVMARGDLVRSAFLRHRDVVDASMRQILLDVERSGALLLRALKAKKKVLVCGNGGSAADSQHFAAELVGRYKGERKALPAIAITVDSSALTSIGNDYGFEQIFSRQIKALGSYGDVLVAISTSGASKNVLEAISAARKKKMRVVALTGEKGSALQKKVDIVIVVPSRETARIQEIHELVFHAWCEFIDAHFSKA